MRIVMRARAFVFAGALTAVAGCGGSNGAHAPDKPLAIAVSGHMAGFALSRGRSFYSAIFDAMVFEGLTRIDTSGRVRPALATRWDTLDGGRRFRFHLRTGVRFHDGSAFSASDVVRAWQTALRITKDDDQHAWMLDPIHGAADVSANGAPLAGVRAIDDSTLDVQLSQPLTIFPQLISQTQAFIGARSSNDTRPVGTGPWAWQTGAADSDSILLARFGAYWGTRPRLASLIVRVVPDSMLLAAFARGDVDCTADLTSESLRALAARTDARLINTTPYGVVRLILDVSRAPLSDVRVRRALAMALDRPRLAANAAFTPAIVANGMLPPGVVGNDSTRPSIAYDPDAARRLLDEAGYPRSRALSLRLPDDNTVGIGAEVNSLLTSYWRAVGLTVLRATQADAHPDIDLHVSYPDSKEPDDYLYSRFHSSVAGTAGNTGNFRDSLVDRWLDSGRVARDSAQRAALMQRTDARIDSLSPNIFLWYIPVTSISTTRLNGCVAGMAYSTFVNTERRAAQGVP